MSKNHPNDNIYSILGKLAALKPTPEETRFALVKEIRESVEAKGSILSGVDAVQAKLAQQFAESDFSKMSTAIQKTGKSKASADAITAVAGREKLGQKEMTRRSVAGRKDESYNPVNAVKQCAKNYMEMNSIHSVHDLEAEDIESIGGDCQMNYQDVCEILGCNLPDSLGPVKSYDEHGDLEESTCNECGMYESKCSCDHTNEGEITRKPGVTTHTKTDYPGYPSDDLEQDDDRTGPKSIGGRGRPRKAQTKNPRPVVGAEKKGRGRPASVKSGTVSMPADPFGRTTGATPKGKRGTVHTMGEAMDLLGKQLGQLHEGRLIDESGETLDHILNRFKHDVKRFEAGEDIYNSDLYHALFDYYSENGEMPYGTQKARDGDPVEFIHDRLNMALADKAYGADPANAEGYGLEQEAIGEPQPGIPGNVPLDDKMSRLNKPRDYYEEEITMEDELNELARLAGLHTNEGNSFSGKLAHTAKGDNFEQDGKTFTNRSSIADKELDEEETDEGNAFGQAVRNAKADGVQDGEKVNVGGKEIPVKEGMEELGQDDSQFNVTTSMSSDGEKNVTVTATGEHAAGLLQMLRIAGLGSSDKAKELEQPNIEIVGGDEGYEEMDEADAPVSEPNQELANAPKEEYSSMRASTMGPGEGDNGEKAMNPDRPTFMNGDNALSNPPARGKEVIKAVAALESKLAAEYESIKKVSK